ncbi:MAG: GNAT family N-acetyltransferase [Sphingomonadales bacterium]|nr:GNAT family N-acetyltransferase [Sphingomonadales bacterium]NCO47870.1 GNAT family N-acetyltransferase [Sphingomonadales bacterium]NCO98979.1 GNAT family N-acetyltransferase [Sphingomonadales bacterium]NCP27650.1 GNAT family N-acetyltransferase [Sphingomonadales bacterium]NCP42192.1 GNAT family N-acetyltransferase [Sphingomonadales bacterium]
MKIRPFQERDAELLAELFHASVHRLGSLDYSSAQLSVWSPAKPSASRYMKQASDGRIFLVAVDENDQPIGYGDLERNGHLDHLYCHPDFAGQGVGKAIYQQLEMAAKDQGISRLFVEASEAARRLFENQGFLIEKRLEHMIDGVLIHNYRMTKDI